ncbi:unnamed protein product [Ambrosiozyma monospora]|uniref:Unnamed protein product n=1 Tax=Ambrosiozyma monospora TaxID=43982 RepID=A0ACB5T063_AMBMO|nr:unnamed protein product [Ambrosiozyma monospora]
MNNNNLSPTKLNAIPAPDLNHPSSKSTSPTRSSVPPAIPSSPQKSNEEEEDSPFIDIETFKKKKVNTSPIDRKEIRECKDTLSQLINSTSSSSSEFESDIEEVSEIGSEVNEETGSTNDDEFHTPTSDRIADTTEAQQHISSKMDDSKSLDLTKGHMSSPVSNSTASSLPSRLGHKKKSSSKSHKIEVDDDGESLIELRSELQHLMQMNKQNINEIESLLESVEHPIYTDPQPQSQPQTQSQSQSQQNQNQNTQQSTTLSMRHKKSQTLRSKFSTSRFLSLAEINSISPPETARSSTQPQHRAGNITPTPPTPANTITTSFNLQDTTPIHHSPSKHAVGVSGPGGYDDDTVMKFDFAESDQYGLKKLIESTQRLIQRQIEVEVDDDDGDDDGEGEGDEKNFVSVAQINPETYENACEVRNALNMLVRTL